MAEARRGVRVGLEPQYEYTHPVEAAVDVNESMYGLSAYLDQTVHGEPVGKQLA